ncbi:MAG: YceI family protein [Anaerolineales bacterium]|nr:MAG: YceI family protein [Anaerolineales bacterium]
MVRIRSWMFVSGISLMMLAACATADPAPVKTAGLDQAQAPIQPTQEAEAPPDPGSAPGEAGSTQAVLMFHIVGEGTQARFIIDEVLRGEPKTVVGATHQVTGEIRVNQENLSLTEVGLITIDAGTLRTDNNFRNAAIENFILQTGSYPLITFAPTSIEGLPTAVVVGETYTFDLTGDLTIREITQSVTFKVSVTVQSKTEIRGTASTTVLREEYELKIPSVPQVAGVSNEVVLELDFTAAP